MIRVLHVFAIMNAGGMENYVMNLYRNMDRTKIQFDFLVHYSREGLFDKEIEALGGRIYKMTIREDNNLFKYIRDLNNFFAKHSEYKIIHGHLSSLAVFYLATARKFSVPWRISHSHGTGHLNTIKGYAKYFLFRGAKRYANVYYACSTEAGKYLFGKRPFEVMPNGVDAARFRYDPSIRAEVRSELGITKEYVIGHVGRFNLQKNHIFILKVFAMVHKVLPSSRLLLIGGGELESRIRQQVSELCLEDAVLFTGVRKDCARLYQALDVFVLPSLFEGLPVTGIEAQYAGLKCLFSDAITRETQISVKTEFLPIGAKNCGLWAEKLIDYANIAPRDRLESNILSSSFDIKHAADDVITRYVSLLGGAT